jgi:glycosyltransferase involved in cell wall biosynthesis
VPPVAGSVDRWQRNDRRPAIELRKLVLRNGAEEANRSPPRQRAKQVGVVPLGWLGVVAGGAHDRELDAVGQCPDEAVDSLVRCQAADEEHAPARALRMGAVAAAVDAAIDDARAGRRRTELVGGILGHHEEAVKQTQERASPRPARQSVVRRHRRAAARPRDQGRDPARRTARVMGVHDVGAGQRTGQARRDGMSGVAEVGHRPEDPDAETARLADASGAPEGDELAVHAAGHGPRELEGVALATAEDPGVAERGGRDVDDPHLSLCMVTLGDPRRMTGGYLYHLRMAAAAPRHGARMAFVSFPERPFPLAAGSAARVFNRVGALGPRAILLDSIAAAFAAPWLAARSPAAPVIGVLHQQPGGIDHGAVRTRLQAPLDRLAYRHARRLIVASELLADQLATAGVDGERIRVVPPGRDVATAAAAEHDLRAGRRAAFLCVGNWIPRKGILELLDAFARLAPDTATLHLAGDEQADPAYARRVRRQLARPDLDERVVVHGVLSREQVAGLYAHADVFVLPAFREPYGTVWGEAMASGLPVVGWRAGNLPYLADDGREGLLVPPGDVAGLARALERLATDAPLRKRLGEAAHRRASARPTWDEAAALFFGAIRDALARGPREGRRPL